MTEIDVLKKISSNLTDRKSSAALSNYQVLSNNISYLNNSLKTTINDLYQIQQELSNALDDNNNLSPDFKTGTNGNPFASIIKRLLLNNLSIFTKFASLTESDNRSNITVDNISNLSRGFTEYNNLVTATRQFIDSTISDSYQLYLLDPKEFNYHVLVSLNSFNKYATKSISNALFNTEINSALQEFETLKYKDWAKSHITECKHSSFGQKVDFLANETSATTVYANIAEELKSIFKFSSEFTHIGYISTFFTSTNGAEVIFGDDKGPYLPSTENFSELKYEILTTACKFVISIYIPCLIKCIEKITCKTVADSISTNLNNICQILLESLNSRNAQYYFFIKSGLTKQNINISLPCRCGTVRNWSFPHKTDDLFCINCGSSFNLMEIEGEGGYIITSAGPAKVIGSNVPDFDDLPVEEQRKMLKEVEQMRNA